VLKDRKDDIKIRILNAFGNEPTDVRADLVVEHSYKLEVI
jgi:hypothetical protein